MVYGGSESRKHSTPEGVHGVRTCPVWGGVRTPSVGRAGYGPVPDWGGNGHLP